MAGDSSKAGASGSATGNRAPAASVGGQRQQLARRTPGRTGAVATNSGRKGASGGILNFYTDDAPGLKVGPTTVLVMSLAFMALVCFLHIMGKFRSGVSSS
eukprot:CAMPEP_0170600930 /NCGR_PEP_ID=MMETSP0224-20130122/17590_1 /TAXON_ID=285029 /ORGANISM="Togula jolla, Strain CCCM 725" /LENGTH=100 /DNA_ID=CAMNT_0010925675 /DNA_START=53 /DNA_END=355 /DNA_ORIENTATION=-